MHSNPSKGMLALEQMVMLLLILLLLFYPFYTLARVEGQRRAYEESQVRFNRLVSIADFVVKSGAAKTDGSVVYPNWIDEERLAGLDRDRLLLNLSRLSVGWEPGPGTCIYRLVVVGEAKTFRRLFVCGD